MSKHKRRKRESFAATPTAEVGNATVEKADNSVTALAALYQGEKTDASYLFNTAMAMMALAVAYLVAAIPFVRTLSSGPFAWLLPALLPMPLWLVLAFQSLITLNAMSHGISVRIIEDALFYSSELGVIPVRRELVGSAAGDKIMDFTQAEKRVHKVASVVVYGGVFALVVGFTAYALYSTQQVVVHDVLLAHRLAVWIASSAYVLLFALVLWSGSAGKSMIDEGRQESRTHEEYWKSFAEVRRAERKLTGMDRLNVRK